MNATNSISIVVPVYNKEDTLDACVRSLLGQTAARDAYEIILVDDGSMDGSLALCERYAARYPNVRTISQENGGVSAARNTGLLAAEGDFVMFVDADDSVNALAVGALRRAIGRFGDAADVVALNIRYYNPHTDRYTVHARSEWLSRTGLYPLDEYPQLAQSTINVCVRNRAKAGEPPVLFDRSLKMGEDQLFVSENLARKGILGYCQEAVYTYVRGAATASRKGNNPLYAYQDMLALYNRLLEIGQEQPRMQSYVSQLILYNMDWRMNSALLFPTHGTQAERDKMEGQLRAVTDRMPACEFAASEYLNDYNKAYLMYRFGKVDTARRPDYQAEATFVPLDDGSVWEAHIPEAAIERCLYEDGVLRLKGRIICPTFFAEPIPTVSLDVDGVGRELALAPSSFSYASARMPITKAYSFDERIGLEGIDCATLRFRCVVGGIEVPAVGVSAWPDVYNARLVDNRAFFDGLVLTFDETQIRASKQAGPGDAFAWDAFNVVHPRGWAFRKQAQALSLRFSRLEGARIWLYADLPTSPAKGNALIQLLHDLQQADGIERFYVTDYVAELEEEYPQLAGHLVQRKSALHLYVSLKAELVLDSYLERWTFSPVLLGDFVQLGDLKSIQRRIYLQHGIMHAHIPWYFSLDRTQFDYIVVSTNFEARNLVERYSYPPDAVLETGAPRFDAISEGLAPVEQRRKIIFAPSWRSYLVTNDSDVRDGFDRAFKESVPYQGMAGLIARIDESGLLERNNYELVLKLHPNYDCYKHLFAFGNPRITLAEDRVDERDFDIVITDFSSYVFDFIYTGARVIYFMPDALEFQAGLNHYRALDIPFEDGFGPYCETVEDAFCALEQMVEGAQPAQEAEAYAKKASELFLFHDGHNTQRLYAAARQIADGLHAGNRAQG